jgi:integral membrane protein (TIGR01906 family)
VGAHGFVRRLAFLTLVVAFPLVALGNALILLLVPWMADVQYAIPGFPADPRGLDGADRARLAEVGIRSIWPFGDGMDRLVSASLPDGEAAFTTKEITHMEDVRHLVRIVLGLWLAALILGGMAIAAFARGGLGKAAVDAIGKGALLTLAVMAALFLASLVAFEPLFDGFHALFFEGDSWKFKDFYTLRRIYPDAFWVNATIALIGLVLAQAVAAGVWCGSFRRSGGRSGG